MPAGEASQIRPLSTSAFNSRKIASLRVSEADDGHSAGDVLLVAGVSLMARPPVVSPRNSAAQHTARREPALPASSSPPNIQADTIVRDTIAAIRPDPTGSTMTGNEASSMPPAISQRVAASSGRPSRPPR